MTRQTNLGHGFRVVDLEIPHSQMRSSPGPQAEFVLWSGFRLCPIAEGAKNEMNANYVKRESLISSGSPYLGKRRWIKDACAQAIGLARAGFRTNVRFRAVDRVMLSIWLSLPFMLLVSSDWIGMVILWQGLSAAARLRQTLPARIRSNGLHGGSINNSQSA
jgi:hypothetical protein